MRLALALAIALFAALAAAASNNALLRDARRQTEATSWLDLFIVAGGQGTSSGIVSSIEMLRFTSSCSFTYQQYIPNMPFPRSHLAAASTNGMMMFAGGKYGRLLHEIY